VTAARRPRDGDPVRRQGPGNGEGAAVTYLQAFVIALIQGVTELFPVSSLGHSVSILRFF